MVARVCAHTCMAAAAAAVAVFIVAAAAAAAAVVADTTVVGKDLEKVTPGTHRKPRSSGRRVSCGVGPGQDAGSAGAKSTREHDAR